MDRIRVSLGPYGYWLKSRDEDDLETVPDALPKRKWLPRGSWRARRRAGCFGALLIHLDPAIVYETD